MVRKSYEDIRDISSILDETIEKGESLIQRDKNKFTDIRKALTHNPFNPVGMQGDNIGKYYSPYRILNDGSYAPHPVEHWEGMDRKQFKKDHTIYRNTRDFYKQVGSGRPEINGNQILSVFARSLYNEIDDLFKAGLPVGTVHEWQGQRYQKQSDGQWTFMAEPGATHPIEQDHSQRLQQVQQELKQRQKGKPEPKTTDDRIGDVQDKEKELDEREHGLKQKEISHQQKELDTRTKEVEKREAVVGIKPEGGKAEKKKKVRQKKLYQSKNRPEQKKQSKMERRMEQRLMGPVEHEIRSNKRVSRV